MRISGGGPLSFLILVTFVTGILSYFRYFNMSFVCVSIGIPLTTHVKVVFVMGLWGLFLLSSLISNSAFGPKYSALNILQKRSLSNLDLNWNQYPFIFGEECIVRPKFGNLAVIILFYLNGSFKSFFMFLITMPKLSKFPSFWEVCFSVGSCLFLSLEFESSFSPDFLCLMFELLASDVPQFFPFRLSLSLSCLVLALFSVSFS